MNDAADRVGAAFEERVGRAPDGVWWAPGRVNLIGEHTDYNDGFVLPLAIGLGIVAAVAWRDDGRLRSWSLQEPEADDVALADLSGGNLEGWTAYPKGVAWALREAGVALRGGDLVIDSTLPQGSGLSSSAALECAVATALAELHRADLDRVEIALLAQRAETEIVGVPSGAMDQLASMLGRDGHALFLDTRSLEVEHVPLDLAGRELALLVLDTRAPRRLANGAYAERRSSCEEAASVLGVAALRDATPEQVEAHADALGEPGYRRARHVVAENARVLETVAALRDGDFECVGRLLNASHVSLRDDYEVSAPALDVAVEAACGAGALGARMTGAGFGGCALALVAADRAAAVEREVVAAFADAGLEDPHVFPVWAADGAKRIA